MAGAPVGRELGRYSFREAVEAGGQDDADDGQGSIMMVVATDAPLSPLKLERLARRAVMGLARTGSFAGNGSGDYVIAFSTAAGVRRTLGEEWTESVEVPNSRLSALFEGTVEATEEAIYNSLLKATTVSGMGRTVEAIDVEAVTRILEKYNVVQPPVPQ
jgi:D-aminopeptidase